MAFNKDQAEAAKAIAEGRDPSRIFLDMPTEEVDARIEARIKGGADAVRPLAAAIPRAPPTIPRAPLRRRVRRV